MSRKRDRARRLTSNLLRAAFNHGRAYEMRRTHPIFCRELKEKRDKAWRAVFDALVDDNDS